MVLSGFSKLPFPKKVNLLHYSRTNYLKNQDVAISLVEKLNLKKQYDKDCKVLDVYSNNLIFSTALYNHLEPSQYLLMEKRKEYANNIKKHLSQLTVPHKFQHIDLNPFEWISYLNITENNKILQPGFESRDHIHSNFLFTGAVCEEALIMQWLGCLGHQNWIQRFGNVKMLLWIPQSTAIKITALPSSKARAKCSVVCQTFADIKLISVTASEDLEKFDKEVLSNDKPQILAPEDFSSKLPMALVELNPKEVHVEDIYDWEFVVKNLMILGHQRLGESVRNLGPGAEEYFNNILPKELLDRKVCELEHEHFITVTKLLKQWAFKPNTIEFYIE